MPFMADEESAPGTLQTTARRIPLHPLYRGQLLPLPASGEAVIHRADLSFVQQLLADLELELRKDLDRIRACTWPASMATDTPRSSFWTDTWPWRGRRNAPAPLQHNSELRYSRHRTLASSSQWWTSNPQLWCVARGTARLPSQPLSKCSQELWSEIHGGAPCAEAAREAGVGPNTAQLHVGY